MKDIQEYLEKMEEAQRKKLSEIVDFIRFNYPELTVEIKWNQPMFIEHDTFIIGFSYSKKHISVAVEKPIKDDYEKRIEASGYHQTIKLFYIRWDQEIDYKLLADLINETRLIKKDYNKFWL